MNVAICDGEEINSGSKEQFLISASELNAGAFLRNPANTFVSKSLSDHFLRSIDIA
jgi:hypothetical protein